MGFQLGDLEVNHVDFLWCTLLKTNSSHLKMVVSNRNLLFQGSIFRCYVSFREGKTVVCTWMLFLPVTYNPQGSNRTTKHQFSRVNFFCFVFRVVGVSWCLCFFAVLFIHCFLFCSENGKRFFHGSPILSYLILSYFLLSDAANIIDIISYLMVPSYNPRDNKKKTEKERQLGKHY